MSDNGMNVTIDTEALVKALGNLADLDVDRALMAGGLVVEAHGKLNIIEYDFIDTGATLNSVAANNAGEGLVQIGPETDYAIFGELGLGGQSEKPFMRRALNEHRDDIVAAIAHELKEQIKSKST
jgi:HK97 gp10 family phage protein